MTRRSGRTPKSPAFQWYAPDVLTDGEFAEMEYDERGVFVTLLSFAWLNDGIPADQERIRRLLRIPPRDFERIWKAVSRCFEPRPGDAERLVNPRQERERVAQAENRARIAELSKRGVEARKNAATEHVNGEPHGQPSGAPHGEPNGSLSSPVSRLPSLDALALSPPRAARSGPRKSNPDSPTPGHAEFVEWWTQAFQAQIGAPYAFAKGKDGEHVRRCLVALKHDLDELKRRATILLHCAPEWIASGGVDLGTLESQLNRLASAGQVDTASGAKHNAIREARTDAPTSSGLFDHRKKQPRLAQ